MRRLATPGIGAALVVAAGAAVALALIRPGSEPASAWTRIGSDTESVGSVVEITPPRPVPALRFTDGTGRPMTLEMLKGQALALNLWATWCVPCRKEMASLDRLQARLGGPGFLVLPLSIDRQGAAVVAPFYRALGLTSLGVYLDPAGIAATAVGADGIPTTLLVDAGGHEVARVSGAAEWDSPNRIAKIRRLLRLPAQAPEQRPRTTSKQPEGSD
jgi:thiol-disulfide isomerase/thioredoxin